MSKPEKTMKGGYVQECGFHPVTDSCCMTSYWCKNDT